MSKFYVVRAGRKNGIFNNWPECEHSVKGFKNASFKSYPTYEEAYLAYTGRLPQEGAKPITSNPIQVKKPLTESICVDAGFSKGTMMMDYQGVDLSSGEYIFRFGPIIGGTNNIGEFLAIVHALAYCKKMDIGYAIYSDSQTALSWIKYKKANTSLEITAENAKVFELVNRAEVWLRNNHYINKVLKWETSLWGENPADYGRK